MKTKEDILYDLGLGLDPKTDSFILEAMEEYAQEVVKNLNIPAVIKSVCDHDRHYSEIDGFAYCNKCGEYMQ